MADIVVTTGGVNIEVTVNNLSINVSTEEKNILVQPANVFMSGVAVSDGSTSIAGATSIIFDGATVTDEGNGTVTVSIDSSGGTWETITGDQSVIDLSGFTNDSGFITSIPSSYLESGDNVSELSNDVGYITGASVPANETDPVFTSWLATPPDVSIFTNDSGYLTSVTAAGVTLDDTNLIVVPETNLQDFADGVDHSLFKARGTGVNTTYVFVATAGGTTFSQPEVFGEIKSDQGYFDVHYTGATGVTVANLNAESTYVYIDKDGTLQQQTSTPTRQDWSRKVFTARIGVNTSTNQIVAFEYLNNPLGNFTNTTRDLYEFLLAQGIPFKKDQIITGRTDNFGFDISAGSLLEFGGTGDIDNPNIKKFDAVANKAYNWMSRTALVSSETDILKVWDNAGTFTPLGSTTWVGQRVYRFSSGNIAIQAGQGNYANLTLAKAGVILEDFELNPALLDATFMGWWFIESIATNTGNTQATVTSSFAPYTLGMQGGSSIGLANALLKGNNLSDILDAEVARANIGAGDVSKVGTPTNDQIAVWTGDGTLEGNAGFTRKSSKYLLTTNLTSSVVLRETSNDMFGIGAMIEGVGHVYINTLTTDINTGYLFGDLSPIGFDGDTAMFGVNDFSDDADQVQANTIYNGDITADTAQVISTARITDGTGFQTDLTESGFGVNSITDGVKFVVNDTNVTVLGENGIDIDPTSDIDVDLITVVVTGLPTFSWNNADYQFNLSAGLDISTTTEAVDSGGPLKINRFRDDVVLTEDITGTDYTNFEAQLRITDESGGYTISDSGLAGGSAALSGFASVEATATVEKLNGVSGVIFQEDAGATVEEGNGIYSGIIAIGGSSIIDASLFNGLIGNFGGNITNLWGLRLPDIDAGSTLNYAIQTGAGLVDFGDQLSVTSESTQLLLINNGAIKTDLFTDASGYLTVSPSGGRTYISDDGNQGSGVQVLNVYGTDGSTFMGIEDSSLDSTVGFQFLNDSQRWDVKLAGNASDKLVFRDNTSGIDKLSIQTGATGDITLFNFGNFGVGLTSGISAKIHSLATTEQLRLGYDSTNYTSFTTVSFGYLNIQPTGNRVGINTTDAEPPQSELHVVDTAGAGVTPTLFSFYTGVFQRNSAVDDDNRIAIISGTTGKARLDFGDADNSDSGAVIYDHSDESLQLQAGSSVRATLDSTGLGIGLDPTAVLTLKAGTATANTAPIKLTAGTNLTTEENGAIEFDGTNLYITIGGVRKTFTVT
jgi:hypothetical protein